MTVAASGEGGGREAAKGAEIVDLKSTLLHTLKNVSQSTKFDAAQLINSKGAIRRKEEDLKNDMRISRQKAFMMH